VRTVSPRLERYLVTASQSVGQPASLSVNQSVGREPTSY
jgi:hypothetical protein